MARLWFRPAPGSEELETEGVISIKGVATVEILKVTDNAVRVLHTVPGNPGESGYLWVRVGDTLKSNIDLRIE